MFKKNFVSLAICLMTFFLLSMTGASFAAQFKFPNKIKYDILVGSKKASSDFSCQSKTDNSGTPLHLLSFGNFQALGFTSRDKIYTFIFKNDLSLSRTILTRGKEKVYEMKAKKAKGMFDNKETTVFVYTEERLLGTIETEPYTPYPVIDLLSLFMVASKSVASGNKRQNFSFFVKKSTKTVELTHRGTEQVSYQGRNVKTTVVELTHQSQEVFKLNIYQDNNGFYFPVQISIEDDEQGLVQFRATKAF